LSTAVRIDQSAAAASVLAPARAVPRTRWWVEAAAIVWLLWVYDAITNLAPLRVHLALVHGQDILNLEQSLHIAPERALDTWLAGHQTLGLILSDYYDNAHFIVTLGVLAWLWWRRPDIYRPLRTALVLANVIAFAVFWRFPVAPPRMLAGFTDVVAATHAIGSWHTGSLSSHANEFAAMPSLHIAWAVWCTVSLWAISKRALVRIAAVIYPFITAFAVLATGNHFVLDMLGGLLTIVLALLISRLIYRPARGSWQAPMVLAASAEKPG
jgi:hypothetical protein